MSVIKGHIAIKDIARKVRKFSRYENLSKYEIENFKFAKLLEEKGKKA